MTVFDDAVFLWNPGDALTVSSDLVSGVSAAGTTEGSIVTNDGHIGRANVGAVASNFNTTVIGGSLTPPIATLHLGVPGRCSPCRGSGLPDGKRPCSSARAAQAMSTSTFRREMGRPVNRHSGSATRAHRRRDRRDPR